jgi:tRNA G18 (ribose-2'-O)-methylase SpoU
MRTRGYFGLALYKPKKAANWGSLVRTANLMDCSFIAVIGGRYPIQPGDTLKTHKHVPVFQYETFEEFNKQCRPMDCSLVGIELTDGAKDLKDFVHPQRAIYMLGAEDSGIPQNVLDQCDQIVKLKGRYSMNVAVAGSIVLYHREGL